MLLSKILGSRRVHWLLYIQLLNSALNGVDRACLLASSTKESGAWLQALPISALWLQLDNDSLRIAVNWAPHCAVLINAGIVERRKMSWASVGWVTCGVKGDITSTLLWMTSSTIPWYLQVCQQGVSHLGCSAVIASDWMVFQWYLGGTESFWYGTPQVWTPMLHLTRTWQFKLRVLLHQELNPWKRSTCMLTCSTHMNLSQFLWCPTVFWAMIMGICERVGEEVEVPDWRGEGNSVPYPTAIHCSPARNCNFHLGRL